MTRPAAGVISARRKCSPAVRASQPSSTVAMLPPASPLTVFVPIGRAPSKKVTWTSSATAVPVFSMVAFRRTGSPARTVTGDAFSIVSLRTGETTRTVMVQVERTGVSGRSPRVEEAVSVTLYVPGVS